MEEKLKAFIQSKEFKKVNARNLCKKTGISYATLQAFRGKKLKSLPSGSLALIEKELKNDSMVWNYLKTL